MKGLLHHPILSVNQSQVRIVQYDKPIAPPAKIGFHRPDISSQFCGKFQSEKEIDFMTRIYDNHRILCRLVQCNFRLNEYIHCIDNFVYNYAMSPSRLCK